MSQAEQEQRQQKEQDVVEVTAPQPNIPVLPFAIRMPSTNSTTMMNTTTPSIPEEGSTTNNDIMGNSGIVGSIVILNKSVMVWVGGGQFDVSSSEDGAAKLLEAATATGKKTDVTVGTGTPTMGQWIVGMPRTQYKGAFGSTSNSNANSSTSTMIGGGSADDHMLASQMASRLSTRSGLAVFVSCQLSDISTCGDLMTGGALMDADTLTHRAAALAEKEIWRLLQERTMTTAATPS